ncbi:MAG: hypothetical protein LC109_05830 [Bacteroidia bacterium]|jgi:hypothetical protein|nr:hypothetical protein [Bacteroidia bacterium]MCO5253106.1 hypothetical protein [Bacteroidota bacterium]MCZ2129772.1 hypothetical protein [Bacteroidia bacterium]
MHDLEPFYNWHHLYQAQEDENSPFFKKEYSELYFTHAVYDHFIHPQWDDFGSTTLYLKILYADYDTGFCIIEMIGEWNDCLYNDVMTLKREIIDVFCDCGVDKFIVIGENVLNFHSSDDSYYEEWYQDAEDGWIVFLNFREHVLNELKSVRIDYFVNFGGDLDALDWRKYTPTTLYHKISEIISHRLG